MRTPDYIDLLEKKGSELAPKRTAQRWNGPGFKLAYDPASKSDTR